MIARVGKWVLFIICIYSIVFVGYKRRGVLHKQVSRFFKKETSFEERTKSFYNYYEEMRQVSDKRTTSSKADARTFDFSKTLLLLDEVGVVLKSGPFLDVTRNPVRKHLVWLKQELENEELAFFNFLALQRRGNTEHISLRTRRSMQFYLRAIKSSIDKLDRALAKVKIKD